MSDSSFEDTVKNLLKMPHMPHKGLGDKETVNQKPDTRYRKRDEEVSPRQKSKSE